MHPPRLDNWHSLPFLLISNLRWNSLLVDGDAGSKKIACATTTGEVLGDDDGGRRRWWTTMMCEGCVVVCNPRCGRVLLTRC
jgi:hypothetical protein